MVKFSRLIFYVLLFFWASSNLNGMLRSEDIIQSEIKAKQNLRSKSKDAQEKARLLVEIQGLQVELKAAQLAAASKAAIPAGHVVVEEKKIKEQEQKLAETTKKLEEAEKNAGTGGGGSGSGGAAAAGEAEALEVLQKILAIYEPDIYAALKIANLLAPLASRTEPKIIEAVAKIKDLLKKQTDAATADIATINAIVPDDALLKAPVDLSDDAKVELKNLKDFILDSTLLELLDDKTNKKVIDDLRNRFITIIGDKAAYDAFAKAFVEKAIGMALHLGLATPVIPAATSATVVIEKITWQECLRLFDVINHDICTAHQASVGKNDYYGLNIKKALEEKFVASTLVEIVADPKKLSDNDKLESKYKVSFGNVLEKIFAEIQDGNLDYDALYKKFIATKPDYFKGIQDLVTVIGALDSIINFPVVLPPEGYDIFKEFIAHLLLIKKPEVDLEKVSFRQKLGIADPIDKALAIPTVSFLDALDIAMLNPKVLTHDQFIGAVKFNQTSIKLLLKEPWRITGSNLESAISLMYAAPADSAKVPIITKQLSDYFKTRDLSVEFALEHIAAIPGLTQASCMAMIESLKSLSFKNSATINAEIDVLLVPLAAQDMAAIKTLYPQLPTQSMDKIAEAFTKKAAIKTGSTSAGKALVSQAQKNFIEIINPLLAKNRVTKELITALSKKNTTTTKKSPQQEDLEFFALLKNEERMVANILKKLQIWIDESTNPVFFQKLPNALYQMLEPYYFLTSIGKMIEQDEKNVEYDAKTKAIKKINTDSIVNSLCQQLSKLRKSTSGSEKDIFIYTAYDELIKALALSVDENVFFNEFGATPDYKNKQEQYLAHMFTTLIAEQMLQFTDPEVFLFQQDWQNFILKGFENIDLLKKNDADRTADEQAANAVNKAAWDAYNAKGKTGPPPPPAAGILSAPKLEAKQIVSPEYVNFLDANKAYFQAIAKIVKANTKTGPIKSPWYLSLSFDKDKKGRKVDFNTVLKIIEYALIKSRCDRLQEFVRGVYDDSFSIPGLYVVDETLEKTKLNATFNFYKSLKASPAFKALKNGLNTIAFDLQNFAFNNTSDLITWVDNLNNEMAKVLSSADKALIVETEDEFNDFLKRQILRAIYVAKNPKIADLTTLLSDPDFNNPARLALLAPDFSKLPAPAVATTIKPGKGSAGTIGGSTSGATVSKPLKSASAKDDYDDLLAALVKVDKKKVEEALTKLTDVNPPMGKEHPIMMLCRGSAPLNKAAVGDILQILNDKGLNFAGVDADGNTILQQILIASSSPLLKKSSLVPIITYLMANPALDVNHQNNDGNTVLHILAGGQNLIENIKPVVSVIIKLAKADVANTNTFRPLEEAVLADNTLFIKQLLENKDKGDVPLDGNALTVLATEKDALKAGLSAGTWNEVLLLLRDKFGVNIATIDSVAAAALATTTSTATSTTSTDPFQAFLDNLTTKKYLKVTSYLESAPNILGSRSVTDQSKALVTLFSLDFDKNISLAQVKTMLENYKKAGINFKGVVDANGNNALHLLCQKNILVDHKLLVSDVNKIIVVLCDDDASIVLAQNGLGQTPLHCLVGGSLLNVLDLLKTFPTRQNNVVSNGESIIKKIQGYGDAKAITDNNGKTPLQIFTDKQVSLGILDSVVQKILKLLK